MITIDIWSDVRCPFCYIGKKNLENALEKYGKKQQVKVEWHSFQLDPSLETRTDISTIEYFKQTKNVSEEQARQMLQGAKEMGESVGVEMDLENSVLANSFRAHQVIQLAKDKGLGDEIEEALFKAHFLEKKNIDDVAHLVEVAESIGLQGTEVREALQEEKYAYAVKQDEMQAQNIGVRGVPFFVFNNKYAVSGAQPADTFVEVLQKVEQEMQN